MTRIAVISDVHGDVHALQDALAHIAKLGCEKIVCAGDLVDFGRFPEKTVALLRQRKIPCVQGNHDRWAIGNGSAAFPDPIEDASGWDASGWSLSSSTMTFLEALPATIRVTIGGVRILLCHARPGSDMEGIYEDAPSSTVIEGWFESCNVDVILVGHTHAPLVRRIKGGRLVANPGMLMREPRNAIDPAMLFDKASGKFVRLEPILGTFGVFDTEKREFVVRRIGSDEIMDVQAR